VPHAADDSVRLRCAYLSFALFACAQTVVVVPSKPSSPVPRMEKGLVDGRTYKNSSTGVELRVAEGLTFGTPELKGNARHRSSALHSHGIAQRNSSETRFGEFRLSFCGRHGSQKSRAG
jgi:hypothetical protein